MNIFEFAEKYNISLQKARKMNKAGLLRLDENTAPELSEILYNLSRGQQLTAAQLVYLIETRGAVTDTGRHAARVKQMIDDLRDGAGRIEPAPALVAAYVSDAAKGEAESVGVLVDWIKETLPPSRPVTHGYIAVRLLLGLAPNVRQYDVPRVPRALYHCRQSDELSGWWRVDEVRKRRVTVYQRPVKNTLANLDL